MEIFKKIKKEINRGVATITVKASTAMEKNELNTFKTTLEDKVLKLKTAVGDQLYEMWRQQEMDLTRLQPMLEEIQSHQEEIIVTQAKIDKIDEESRSILGVEENRVPETNPSTEIYTCQSCGAQFQTPFKFCRKCGKPYQE